MLWSFDDELRSRKLNLIANGYDAYCFFVLSGQELNIADEINNNYDYAIATPLTKMSHRSRKGYKYDVQEILLAGYVFCFLPKGEDIFKIKSSKNILRILNWKNDDGKLYGSDKEYADWILEVEGFLTVSQAINMNGKVKIINGPLKNLEGHIVEYSKHNRNCKIEINLLNQTINAWLPFDWVDMDMDDINIKLH